MKKTAILLCLSTFFSLMINAQTIISKDDIKQLVRVKSLQKNNFGDNYTHEVSFGIRGDSISGVAIVPKDDQLEYLRSEFYQGPFKQKFKFFDFNFQADPLVFKKDYPKIQFPTKKQIDSVKSNIQIDSISYYHLSSVQQFTDSTIFIFRRKPLQPRQTPDAPTAVIPTSWGKSAEFLGNLKNVENKISEKIKLKKVKIGIDSIIVFRALVTREEYPLSDSLIVENLLFGKLSAFSETVKDVLLSQENREFWRAAVSANTGQRMTTRIKIFAQLNKNGTVKIQFPRLLGNWTGD